jgi:hypothetical protein
LQTSNYPNSLAITDTFAPFYLYLGASQPATLFSQSIDGSTVSPTFSSLTLYSADSVTLTEAPEPSIGAYLLASVAGLIVWRWLWLARRGAC